MFNIIIIIIHNCQSSSPYVENIVKLIEPVLCIAQHTMDPDRSWFDRSTVTPSVTEDSISPVLPNERQSGSE